MQKQMVIPSLTGTDIPICPDCAKAVGAVTVTIEVAILEPCHRCNEPADGDLYHYTKLCMLCGEQAHVYLNGSQHRRYTMNVCPDGSPGRFIQDVLPDLPADTRETLISGSHPGCFDKAFADEG